MVRRSRPSRLKSTGAIVGGFLLGIGIVWFAWQFLLQPGHSLTTSVQSSTNGTSANSAETQASPLLAAGIVLGHPNQKPSLSQQQALLLASQREPEAAAKAKKTEARYVLLNYPAVSGSTTQHPSVSNAPTWMIWYQQVPSRATDAEADPTPLAEPQHDLYIFLDANAGNELFSLWV